MADNRAAGQRWELRASPLTVIIFIAVCGFGVLELITDIVRPWDGDDAHWAYERAILIDYNLELRRENERLKQRLTELGEEPE